jgi:hypothetical protein
MRAIVTSVIGLTLLGLGYAVPAAGQTLDDLRFVVREDTTLDATTSYALQQAQPFCCQKKYFWPTMGEIGLLLVIPHYFNRWVADDSTAVLSLDSWEQNIEQGFEWDRDNFRTNMFMHPYHGNVYFNSARSNGYNFWESSAFAWGGSFLWEFFGENNRPAINDWVATAMGGIALGEMLNRTSRMLWDNSATGSGRTWRELGGLLLNPMGGANRLFRGEMTRVGPNPPDRFPGHVRSFLALGARRIAEEDLSKGTTGGFFSTDISYGDPFEEYEKPYDSFLLSFQINGKTEKQSLGRLQVEGVLYGTELKRSTKAQHVFHFTQHFDYVNNKTLETGGSSVSANFMSDFQLSERWDLVTKVEPSALIIWGIDSEFSDFTRRNYDFGSGAGLRLFAAANHDDRQLFHFFYYFFWQHTLNGAAGDHLLQYFGLRAAVPLYREFGVGAEYILSTRDSRFRDFPDVFRRNPQFRLFGAVFLD